MRQAPRGVENPDSIASKRGRTRRRVFACLFAHALFAAAVLFVTLHHEPWRDEADSWLLTRDTTLSQMLRVLPYAGTQAFWYLLLDPWASSGLPFVTQSLINWAIMATAAGLLIWRSPFPLYISIPTCFSYFLAYEYGVIARSYALGVLMLFLAVLSWRSRADHPIRFAVAIGLLMNVNVPSLILACAFVAGFCATPQVIARMRTLPVRIAFVVMASALAVSVIQILPPHDVVHPQMFQFRGSQLFDAIRLAFFPGTLSQVYTVIGLELLILVAIQAARSERALLVIYLTGLAGSLILVVFVILAAPRHYGFLFVLTLSVLWLSWEDASRSTRMATMLLLAPVLVFSSVAALKAGALDVLRPFSAAKEMARFIKDHGYENARIAAHPPSVTEAILPWLPGTRLLYVGEGRWGTYMRWDSAFEKSAWAPSLAVTREAVERIANDPEMYCLLGYEIPDSLRESVNLVYATRGQPFAKSDERYWLYRRAPTKR